MLVDLERITQPRGLSEGGAEDEPVIARRFLCAEDSFPEQWVFVTTEEREIMVLTGRQAGKTSGCLLRAVRMATERAGSKTLYVCFDLDIGREVFFEAGCELLQKLGWKFEANATRLRIKLENGSIIQIKSSDNRRKSGRLRGRNWDLIIIDELQELTPEVAQNLIVDVCGPMQFRRAGSIVLAFTPPDIQHGWVWDEFSSGRWKLFQIPMGANKFLPPGETDRWLAKRGLTLDHPIAKREVLGLWEPNTENLVFSAFNYQVNTYDPCVDDPKKAAILPLFLPADQWCFGTGSDIGWQHDDSIILVAWNAHDPQQRIWEVLTFKQNHQDIDQFFDRFVEVTLGRKPLRSNIMDQAGAGGMKVVATVQNRFAKKGMPIWLHYKPTSVVASVGLVNDSFRVGRLLLRRDSPLLDELPKTVWKVGSNRQEIDKGKFDPHGLDGLRYAVWGATNYKALTPLAVPEPTPEEKFRAMVAERASGKGKNRPFG